MLHLWYQSMSHQLVAVEQQLGLLLWSWWVALRFHMLIRIFYRWMTSEETVFSARLRCQKNIKEGKFKWLYHDYGSSELNLKKVLLLSKLFMLIRLLKIVSTRNSNSPVDFPEFNSQKFSISHFISIVYLSL